MQTKWSRGWEGAGAREGVREGCGGVGEKGRSRRGREEGVWEDVAGIDENSVRTWGEWVSTNRLPLASFQRERGV